MVKRKNRGGFVRKKRKRDINQKEDEELIKAPHTFVFKRGAVNLNVRELVMNMRKVMEPFTARNLKAHKKNCLKDFISVAGPLGVTNLIIFSKTDIAPYMKICRMPRGPTLTFKLHQYSLTNDIISSLRRPDVREKLFYHHPLVVLSNFSGEGFHLKLMASLFQNMFPSININRVKLTDVRRCVLFNYNPETKFIDFRHYTIKAIPKDVSKPMKKLVLNKIPNLGKFHDFSDYLIQENNFSESEGELDGSHNQIIATQNLPGRGALPTHKNAVRLTELGPRMTLKLIKIQEGICDGEVLFHDHIKKSPEELKMMKGKRIEKSKLKEKRKNQQEINVARKKKLKAEHKQKSLQGMKRKTGETPQNAEASDTDDDAEWFYKETGVQPEDDMFPTKKLKMTDGDSFEN